MKKVGEAVVAPGRRTKRRRSLVFILLLGMVLFPGTVRAQDGIPAGTQAEAARLNDLLDEMLSAYRAGGEEGIRAWVRANRDRIGADFVFFIAQGAGKVPDEDTLDAAQLIAREKGDRGILASVYLIGADYHLRISRPKGALDDLEAAEPIYVESGDVLGQGQVCYLEGEAYSQLGEKDRAMALYERSLILFLKARDFLGQGNALFRRGEIHASRGENGKAWALFEEALPAYGEAGNSRGKGNVFLAMGHIRFLIGESAKALALYEEALAFYAAAGDLQGQGNVHFREAEIYYCAGDMGEALARYEKALPFYIEAKAPVGQGTVYGAEADIHSLMGNSEEALRLCEKARPFLAQEPSLRGLANLCVIEGNVHARKGENGRALAMYEKARPLAEQTRDPLDRGLIEMNEADIYSRTGEPVKALEKYDLAISWFDGAEVLDDLAYARLGKANVLLGQGRNIEALELAEEALAELERVRARTDLPGLKRSFLQTVYDLYDQAASLMLRERYPEKGFRVVESMKARLFLDQLAESLAEVERGLSPKLRERRDDLTGRISVLEKSIQAAALRMLAAEEGNEGKDIARAARAELSNLKDERDRVQAEFEKLQTDIRLKSPAYAAVRYPEPVRLDGLQKVLKPGELLVEYYLSVKKAFAFVVTREAFKAVELPADAEQIESSAQRYLAWLTDPYYRPGSEEGRLAAGTDLYAKLLKPLEADLSEGATIIVVPDGILARLPFESLVSARDAGKKAVYLLEKHPVKYIQSASVLAFLRTQAEPEGVSEDFVGFGDPVYDYEHFLKNETERVGSERPRGDASAELNRDRFSRSGGTLDRLEGSGKEVEAVAGIFRAKAGSFADRATVYRREKATEENAKAASMERFGYILFSCHGLLGDGYQCLALSQIPGAKEDGFLTLDEIMNCKYRARLVVLSACQTGKGREERGEGVTGLTRAVMYAGTPAALVSLWSVSDEATRQLMVGFFQRLVADGLPKDEALRRAKLELLNGKEGFPLSDDQSVFISHPFFWAAFVMYGE